jgi:hypothetical protein
MSDSRDDQPGPREQENEAGRKASEDSTTVGSSVRWEDILALQDLDPALDRKMHLLNNVSI